MAERKLASVRRTDAINPIDGADLIEVATVGGWKVVVKRGEYKPGDLAVYFEIDSFIPTGIAPFLTKEGKEPKEYNGVKGERLKTVKLRGQISQGLIIPVPANANKPVEGKDLTEELGIQKWEPPVSISLGGQARGSFPTHLVGKTDAERIQNATRQFGKWAEDRSVVVVTEKLDGTSFTATTDGDTVYVCSRNLSLKDDGNLYWNIAKENHIPEWLEAQAGRGKLYAIQGEIIGPGIQGNLYGLQKPELHIFSIWDVKSQKYLDFYKIIDLANAEDVALEWNFSNARYLIGRALRFAFKGKFKRAVSVLRQTDLKPQWKVVPVVGQDRLGIGFGYEDVETILKTAEGKSILNPKAEREGLVFWGANDQNIKFKAVSNRWLMRHDS